MDLRAYIGKDFKQNGPENAYHVYHEIGRWPTVELVVKKGDETWDNPTFSLKLETTPENKIISITRLKDGSIFNSDEESEQLFQQALDRDTTGSSRPMGVFSISVTDFEAAFVNQLLGRQFQKDSINSSLFSKTSNGLRWTYEKGKTKVEVLMVLKPETHIIEEAHIKSNNSKVPRSIVEAFGLMLQCDTQAVIQKKQENKAERLMTANKVVDSVLQGKEIKDWLEFWHSIPLVLKNSSPERTKEILEALLTIKTDNIVWFQYMPVADNISASYLPENYHSRLFKEATRRFQEEEEKNTFEWRSFFSASAGLNFLNRVEKVIIDKKE